MNRDERLRWSLFSLRFAVFIVMMAWTADKFLRPAHAGKVFANFYLLPEWGKAAFLVIGLSEALVLAAFIAGYKKRLSYGLVLLFHAVSTLSSYKQYLSPFEGLNLLFFAAWPMLAACWSLYLLRDEDTLWSCRA
ncbi:MAG: hypothetical protein HYZ75_00625 [Elusimicrobia bacterium]|nr:hypothetical protein [Elusimicrobiota bacterium]